MTCTRRDALKGIASVGVAAVAPGCSGLVDAPKKQRFTARELWALEAAAERLLPGAKDAGVMAFIDYWLEHAPFEVVERYLVTGALFLDKGAQERGGESFAAATPQVQDEILVEFASGKATSGKFDSNRFFRQFLELVLESYLGHPKYGGNRDAVGWRFIGLPDGLRSCWWNPHGLSTVLNPDNGFSD